MHKQFLNKGDNKNIDIHVSKLRTMTKAQLLHLLWLINTTTKTDLKTNKRV
jgi:SPX domain protein involved in polyphosphate accumulation